LLGGGGLSRDGYRPTKTEVDVNAYGWAIMITSVGSVLWLTGFCLYRVLTLPPEVVEEHFKAPLDIDTKDTQHPD
jgi:hypothetical protein